MKKTTTTSLRRFASLFAVNAVVEGLVLMALLLRLSTDDPLLAALPLIVATPALVAQPWFIGFFLIPRGYVLAPLLTTAVTIPVYTLLNRTGKLEWMKPSLRRLRCKRTAVIAGVLLVVLLAVGYARYVDFPERRHGIPPIRQLDVNNLGVDCRDSKHYCLGAFFDVAWLWRAELPEPAVNQIAERLSMCSIPAAQVGQEFLHMPPYWWKPVLSHPVRVLSTTNFPAASRGPDGLHAMAIWNPSDQVFHLWIKNNF